MTADLDARDVAFALLPLVVVAVLATAFVLTLRRREASANRPWWGNPWLWFGVSLVSLVLGLLVRPAWFGGVFVFLPFVWIGKPRGPRVDPRGNGHSQEGGQRLSG